MRDTRVATLVLAAAMPFLHGQGLGTISGTISDPSGAVIPGAKITTTETGTGLSRTAVSSSEGYFVIPSLRPSDYNVDVDAGGFRKYTRKGVTLQADQSVTLNVTLEVGTTTENVIVSADAQQVDTTKGTLSQVVDSARIVELPLNGRNAAQLTLLVPGAVVSTNGGADQGDTKTFPGAVTISANGSRQNQISYQLDGGNNVDEYTNVNQPFPFPDALQEFSVQTSNYSAEYGQNAGAVVNIITKSGSNDLHGDVFGFLRNAVFNARNFFSAKRDQLKRGQYGGTFGGPLTIPGLYNGRDKTFFFLGFQRTTLRNIGSTSSAFVPTAANIAGDFSSFGRQIIDPSNLQPFGGNRVPTSQFDKASVALLKYLPQAGGDGRVFFSKPLSQDFYEGVAKVDHSISLNDRISARYYGAHFSKIAIFEPTDILSYADGSNIFSQNALVKETHLFTSALVNDFRFNYSREKSDRGPASSVPNVRDLGVSIPFQPPAKAIQSINVNGFFSFGDNPPARFTRNNFTFGDDLRWIKGGHSMSFGVSAERSRVDLDNLFNSPGVFQFTSDVTNNAVASFLLGHMHFFQQGFGEFKNNRNTFLGLYAQDNYRVSQRLTVNFGLRWEPFSAWDEIRGRVEQFRPDAARAGLKSQVYINAPAGLFFPGDPGVPSRGVNTNYLNFAPRVGFAYDVFGDGKTSLRGGAGMFYDSRQNGIVNNRFVDLTPFSPQLTITEPKGSFSDPLLGITSPFPAPFPPPKNASFYPCPVPTSCPVQVVTYDPYKSHYITPVIYNFNLAIERQIAADWLLRLAYVGSHSSHIFETIELNPSLYIPGSTLGTDQRRIFPGLSTVSLDSQSVNASYNSMQVSLEKRFSRGYTILANYTWAKSLDTLPEGGNVAGPDAGQSSPVPYIFPDFQKMDRGPSDFDHRHRFVTSFVWQSPKLTGWNMLARGVLANWQFSGVITAQSGGPVTIFAGQDQSRSGIGNDRAVISGPAYGPGACAKVTTFCVDYLTPGSFGLPAVGTYGNLGKGAIRGPDLVTVDAGLFKDFPIKERYRLQFRGEFFNLLNRVNFNYPGNNSTVSDTNTKYTAGGFGSIQSAFDPRIVQLALKFIF